MRTASNDRSEEEEAEETTRGGRVRKRSEEEESESGGEATERRSQQQAERSQRISEIVYEQSKHAVEVVRHNVAEIDQRAVAVTKAEAEMKEQMRNLMNIGAELCLRQQRQDEQIKQMAKLLGDKKENRHAGALEVETSTPQHQQQPTYHCAPQNSTGFGPQANAGGRGSSGEAPENMMVSSPTGNSRNQPNRQQYEKEWHMQKATALASVARGRLEETQRLVCHGELAVSDYNNAVDTCAAKKDRDRLDKLAWMTLEEAGAGLDRFHEAVDDLIKAVNVGGLHSEYNVMPCLTDMQQNMKNLRDCINEGRHQLEVGGGIVRREEGRKQQQAEEQTRRAAAERSTQEERTRATRAAIRDHDNKRRGNSTSWRREDCERRTKGKRTG